MKMTVAQLCQLCFVSFVSGSSRGDQAVDVGENSVDDDRFSECGLEGCMFEDVV